MSRAFTLVDVLVCIAIIAVLIGLLIPTLGRVNETARRVVCQSNVRQVGLGVVMYADEHKGQLPPSKFVQRGPVNRDGSSGFAPQRTITVREAVPDVATPTGVWDGLGALFDQGYLPAPKVFYCPSHWGEHPFTRYSMEWSPTGGLIVCNYHYRAEGPMRPVAPGSPSAPTTSALYLIDPAQSSLIADGMETRSDYNHRTGVNFFRADLTVHWFEDPVGELAGLLPSDKNDANAAQDVTDAWHRFDTSANQNN